MTLLALDAKGMVDQDALQECPHNATPSDQREAIPRLFDGSIRRIAQKVGEAGLVRRCRAMTNCWARRRIWCVTSPWRLGRGVVLGDFAAVLAQRHEMSTDSCELYRMGGRTHDADSLILRLLFWSSRSCRNRSR